MRKTVVGTFDSAAEAEQVAEQLVEQGFDRDDIDVRATATTTDKATASRESTSESTSWWEWLFGESEDRSYYSERVSRGGAVLAITTDERGAARARRLMEAEGGDVETSEQASEQQPVAARPEPESEEVLPVVEERLRIGKRPVAVGAVRVYSRVTERPVEEQVPLQEEHVRIERRPADRPVSDVGAFRDDVIEIEETAEEVVVAKEARVVEEVIVSKDVDERMEQVRDRVRHTEIDVERGEGGTRHSHAFKGDDADFRGHWMQTGRNRDLSYEQSAPAYQFGHELAGDERDWSAIELEARRRWEERSPGTWERVVDAVRYAWERARGSRRAA